MNPLLIGVIILVVLVGGGVLVMNSQKKNTSPTTSTVPSQAIEQKDKTEGPSVGPSGAMEEKNASSKVKTFTVEGGSFFFKPDKITIDKGDKVKIIFNNSGGIHNLVLDEFNVKMEPIQAGQSRTLEFTADKAGTFEYYCSVGNHRQMGMVGTLVVKE